MKPILFNTEMVRAILDGRKTVTRRPIKVRLKDNEFSWQIITNKHSGEFIRIETLDEWEDEVRWIHSPVSPGDILYVRETFARPYGKGFFYAADYQDVDIVPADCGNVSVSKNLIKWRPSIHMPKEAARIFLRVTGVRVERLQDMSEDDVVAEGAESLIQCPNEHPTYNADGSYGEMCWNTDCCRHCEYINKSCAELFGALVWDSIIKKEDIDLYGWDANPWVWVIEFERCEKPKGE